MDILGLTTINKFDNEAYYLVCLELSEEEKERIADKNSHWKNIIDSAIAHVLVINGEITYVDLSVIYLKKKSLLHSPIKQTIRCCV